MSEKIKVCPFCGKEPFYRPGNSDFGRVSLHCGCAVGAGSSKYEPDEKVIQTWNTRPVEDKLHAEIERLRKVLEHYANPEVWSGERRDVYEDYDGYAAAQKALKK